MRCRNTNSTSTRNSAAGWASARLHGTPVAAALAADRAVHGYTGEGSVRRGVVARRSRCRLARSILGAARREDELSMPLFCSWTRRAGFNRAGTSRATHGYSENQRRYPNVDAAANPGDVIVTGLVVLVDQVQPLDDPVLAR